MYNSSKLIPAGLQGFDTATLTGGIDPIGTPTTESTRIYWLSNQSNVALTFFWNNTPILVLPAGAFFLLDVSANRETSNILEIPAGTQTGVAGNAGIGFVFVSTFYAG